MFEALFQQVQQLTQQAAAFVKTGEVDTCQAVLVERQQCLESLDKQIKSLQANSITDIEIIKFNVIKQNYIELLIWIQQQDAPAIIQATQLKNAHQKKIIHQNKTAHAIKQYTRL